MQWGDTSSPRKPRKCLQTLKARKLIATGFGDMNGVLLIYFLDCGSTINSEIYCDILQKLRRAIQIKRRGKLSSKDLFLHHNAHPHTANRTQKLLVALDGRCLVAHHTAQILRQAIITSFQQ
ncbi:hypothetical protein AVEN_64149-1 [Araneus ventricosus]|uniref:Mariner Mos1 transposase n=1 Tax=Araneus ventricosus TaxID=182803 RepID=A0A4Y2C3Y0_ARAVE|nr:hypothetical protein AVEN_64149-1 [Araneus ventricosus]